MSSKWSVLTWGDVVTLEYGKSIRDYQTADGQYPVYGTNGPIGWHHTALCPTSGVIVGRKGAYRGIHFSHRPFFVIDTAFYLRPKVELDLKWAYYCLLTCDINGMDSGSAIPSTSRSDFYTLPVLLPTIEEQRAIADFLGLLDDRIALLRETNSTLERIAEALFKSWFVDFDPVRTKQEKRALDGMDEATAALFPDSFDESVLGAVPAGWRVGPILEIAFLLSGGTPKTTRPEYWGGSVAWASAKDVSQSTNSMLIETERTITQRGLEESSTRLVPALSTVVVARGATTGRMVLLGDTMAMNQTCYALESKIRTPLALYCQLRREIDTLVGAAHGSVFDTITTSTFAQSKVVQPPQALLEKFEVVVNPIFQKILFGTRSLQTLVSLRDTLLPRLISGQLRLPGATEMSVQLKTGT